MNYSKGLDGYNAPTVSFPTEASGIVFSSKRVNHYPRERKALKQYLEDNSIEHEDLGMIVDVEQFMASQKTTTGNRGWNIDLNKTLYAEFAKLRAKPVANQVSFTDAISGKSDRDLLEGMLGVLQEKVTMSEQEMQEMQEMIVRKEQSTREQKQQLEELAAYLLSSMIRVGIEFRSDVYTRDIIDLCRKGIDVLLENLNRGVYNGGKGKELRNDSDGGGVCGQAFESDLSTAFQDLQLAHRFLTERFRDDRKQYLDQIDQLNKRNKKLKQELLGKDLQSHRSRNFTGKLDSVSLAQSMPTSLRDGFENSLEFKDDKLGSQSTALTSFHVMKQEFKKLLDEIQSKYEKELHEEREIRRNLEIQLSNQSVKYI